MQAVGEFVVLFERGSSEESPLALVAVQFGKGLGQPIDRTADDGYIVVVFEVAHQGGLGRQVLEILAEILVTASSPLVVLESSPKKFMARE